MVTSYDAQLHVTKRAGKAFTAEWARTDGRNSWEIEGKIDSGGVTFTVTKDLIGQTEDVVGLHKFTGRLTKGALKGTVKSPKSDKTMKGEVNLKLMKD